MKVKPFGVGPAHPGPSAYRAEAQGGVNPRQLGDAIEPFLVAGGLTTFIFADGPPAFDAQPDGVQLLTSIYVPRGRTGWIKQLRVAPYMPAVLANPWQGWDGTWQNFTPFGLATDIYRATAQAGVYTTPMGWESYFDAGTEVPAEWHWWLTCFPGSLGQARQNLNIGPFSPTDPASWYLVESIPVPSSAYPQGVPGRALAGTVGPQRMQVLQGDALDWHVMIPEDSTACLWAQWKQSTVSVTARNASGEALVMASVHPLLPSFGQLLGYTQANNSDATIANAREGWGG